MFSVSKLSEEQKQTIHGWAAAGDQIADIQRKMGSEMEINITYMEARFLVLDLGVEIQTEVDEEPEEEVEEEKIATGEVTVSVDELIRPGFAISGRVEFSDGEKALWGIDQMGRLSLDSDTPGYKPSEEDITKFQDQLRAQLETMR